jgi:hypothetical protein
MDIASQDEQRLMKILFFSNPTFPLDSLVSIAESPTLNSENLSVRPGQQAY